MPDHLELGCDGHLSTENSWIEKSISFIPLTSQSKVDVTHQLIHWIVPLVIFTLLTQVDAISKDIPHSCPEHLSETLILSLF